MPEGVRVRNESETLTPRYSEGQGLEAGSCQHLEATPLSRMPTVDPLEAYSVCMCVVKVRTRTNINSSMRLHVYIAACMYIEAVDIACMHTLVHRR